MDLFLGSPKPPDLKQEINSLYRIITKEDIETVIKFLPARARWIERRILLDFHEVHLILFNLFNNSSNNNNN